MTCSELVFSTTRGYLARAREVRAGEDAGRAPTVDMARDGTDAEKGPAPARTRKAIMVGLVGCAVLGVLAWKWWPYKSSPAQPGLDSAALEDPRLTFPTTFRNVRPGVHYVGDAACASCHREIASKYRQHPMGQSLAPIAQATAIENYAPGLNNPFTALGFRYQVTRQGERVIHGESFIDALSLEVVRYDSEVNYALGSGQKGRSYLIDRQGYLFLSPITWYPQKAIWDISPGYNARNHPHFGRPVVAGCLFCHANQVDAVETTANRYREPIFQGTAIGCERCHGPGELHVQRRRADEPVEAIDDSIVNPRHLEHALREAVCQQCHLQGAQRVVRRGRGLFEYRPGMPTDFFFSDWVKAGASDGEGKFVGTVEQMYASRCFRESRGENKLGCISCHDPHELPGADMKDSYYRERCLNCHAQRGCSLPPAKRQALGKPDDCVACHMTKTGSDVAHTAVVDHRILRAPLNTKSQRTDPWPIAAESPLRQFLAGPSRETKDHTRDLGIALVEMAGEQPDAPARDLAQRALPLLNEALASHPDDLAALDAKGNALWHVGKLEEVLQIFESVLEKDQDREATLYLASTLALRLGRPEKAKAWAERAVAGNPWRWQLQWSLARALMERKDWQAASARCVEVLRLQPTHLETRRDLIMALFRSGNGPGAQREFEMLQRFVPAEQRASLLQWYELQKSRE